MISAPIDTADRVIVPHLVDFYQRDDELIARVADYVARALAGGSAAIVIATGEHRAALDAALAGLGIDAPTARGDGSLTALDAADTLARFMVEDHPSPEGFDRVVGDLVRATAASRPALAAFGEMVALLWAEGNVQAALELEELWNDLLQEVGFTLLCAYPSELVESDDGKEHVCALHTTVSQRFGNTPDASAAARRLTRAALSRWGVNGAHDDATLIVSELAANAVKHASSEFVVSLAMRDGAVRICVEDFQPLGLQPRSAAESGGSGLVLVETLARECGVHATADGKLVWADVAADSAPHAWNRTTSTSQTGS